MSFIQIRLFCEHPKTGRWIETKLHVEQSKTLKETTEIAWKVNKSIMKVFHFYWSKLILAKIAPHDPEELKIAESFI